MSIYVLGDVHGAYKALVQVFERSDFVREEDQLIFLGDVADGWSQTPECVDFLLNIPDRILIQGNHDWWTHQWMLGKGAVYEWRSQGGKATFDAYEKLPSSVRARHKQEYFDKMVPYYEQDKNLFVHGGFDWRLPIEMQDGFSLCWDRDLWRQAAQHNFQVKDYDEVFIGHTTTTRTSLVPEQRNNVWNLDQGAGWEGKLSLMNIETKEFWQSDVVKTLYPEEKGR